MLVHNTPPNLLSFFSGANNAHGNQGTIPRQSFAVDLLVGAISSFMRTSCAVQVARRGIGYHLMFMERKGGISGLSNIGNYMS